MDTDGEEGMEMLRKHRASPNKTNCHKAINHGTKWAPGDETERTAATTEVVVAESRANRPPSSATTNHPSRYPLIRRVLCYLLVALVLSLYFQDKPRKRTKHASLVGGPSSSTMTGPASPSDTSNRTGAIDTTGIVRDDHDTTSIRIASMNLASCQPSAEAPPSWDMWQSASEARKELLKNDPDVIALQECPGEDVAMKMFQNNSRGGDNFGYQVIGSTPAHAGDVVLLIRKEWMVRHNVRRIVPDDRFLPVVMAEINVVESASNTENRPAIHNRNISFVVGSCHLAPFVQGSFERQQQVEDAIDRASPLPLILAGDTNMRATEDSVMEGDPLFLLDAWKQNGSNPKTSNTWDTVDHRSSSSPTAKDEPVGTFNRYYGYTTRQYTARYDRIYISQPHMRDPLIITEIAQKQQMQGQQKPASLQVSLLREVQAPRFDLIANRPLLGSQTHFLSDHFGVSATIDLVWENE